MLKTIKDVIKVIEEISNAAGDGAGGTTDIAMRISEINTKTNQLLDEALKSYESANKLKQDISKFKI